MKVLLANYYYLHSESLSRARSKTILFPRPPPAQAPIPYKFEYGVKDYHTGDNKEAWEHSDGHHVKGMYSLYEPDGTKRIVEYTADPKLGFQAVVKRVGHATHDYIAKHH